MNLGDLFTAAGYLTGIAVFARFAWLRGLAPEVIAGLIAASLAGGAVGAIGLHLFFTGFAGKSIFAGLGGGWLAVWAYKRRRGLRRDTGDMFALGLSAGEAVGRWGCFFNGCCYGLPCSSAWAVYQEGAWRYPTQLMQSLASAVLFAVLAYRFRLSKVEGKLFYWYLLGESLIRLIVEFWRDGAQPVGGLRLVQWVCLGVVLVILQRRGELLTEGNLATSWSAKIV